VSPEPESGEGASACAGVGGPAVRGRLRPLTEGRLTAPQREMWRELAAGPRGVTAVRPEGFLTGPFDVLLRSPEIGRAVAGLGALLRYESALTQRQRELVICTVAARWRAEFAWLRHDGYARDAGVPGAAVEAIAAGTEPVFDDEGDRVLYAFVHALAHTGAAERDAYDAALALLGERSLVEAVALTGYYCLSSMLLNAFEVPLPQGESAPWHRAGSGPTGGSEPTGPAGPAGSVPAAVPVVPAAGGAPLSPPGVSDPDAEPAVSAEPPGPAGSGAAAVPGVTVAGAEPLPVAGRTDHHPREEDR